RRGGLGNNKVGVSDPRAACGTPPPFQGRDYVKLPVVRGRRERSELGGRSSNGIQADTILGFGHHWVYATRILSLIAQTRRTADDNSKEAIGAELEKSGNSCRQRSASSACVSARRSC